MNPKMEDRIMHTVQGAAAGALILLIGGAYWPGWSLESTVKKRVAENSQSALVKVLGPVCEAKFRASPELAATVVKIKAANSWQRAQFMVENGFVIKTGSASTDVAVGDACVDKLDDLIR